MLYHWATKRSGIEHFVIVIQIIITETRKEYLVLVDSKKDKEGRKTFFSKTKTKIYKRRRCSAGKSHIRQMY